MKPNRIAAAISRLIGSLRQPPAGVVVPPNPLHPPILTETERKRLLALRVSGTNSPSAAAASDNSTNEEGK